ncbi:PREDICTED: uncharacterized protein [Prunus dulcis]|uniref:PREDICTED: uncharacterized protein n=1 Tax=Prunus dulcis TaxID=3755 RepID=A0A5E4FUL9_PRUDU|nr:PREDICTED: uncharacterized protein [Prunus dulcis]
MPVFKREREAEVARHNSSEVEDNASESEHSDMSAPRSISVPGHREMRSGKKPEQSVKKYHHAPQVVLGLNSPNAGFTLSTPSRRHTQQDPIPRVPPLASSGGENDFDPLEVWRLTFMKSNRSLVTLSDGLWRNSGALDVVLRGLARPSEDQPFAKQNKKKINIIQLRSKGIDSLSASLALQWEARQGM